MKNTLKPVELFLALGLTVAIGACGGPAADTTGDETVDEAPTEQVAPETEGAEDAEEAEEAEETEGGEGGEGGEG